MAAPNSTLTIPALGLCLVFGITSALSAQDQEQQQQQQTRPSQQQASQSGQPSEVMDVLLTTWLIGDNNVEVQLSRLAIDRSQNEQVRQFAQRMVQEHQQLIEQLHRKGMGVEAGQQSQQQRQQGQQARQQEQRSSLQAQQEQQQQQPRVTQQQSGQQRQPMAQRLQQQGQRQAGYRPQDDQQQISSRPAMQLLQIHKEMGDQFVKHMRQELQNKQGAAFDRAFMGGQIVAHVHMLSTLEAMQNHASPELKPSIEQAITHTQQHLQEARNIANQLESGAAATAAQPERRETQRQ